MKTRSGEGQKGTPMEPYGIRHIGVSTSQEAPLSLGVHGVYWGFIT